MNMVDRHEAPAVTAAFGSARVTRELLDAAPDAIVGADREGRLVFVNAQTEHLFGYLRDELIGRPIELLVPERDRVRHAAHRGAYLANPRARAMGAGLGLHGRRRDGSEFPAEISLSSLETEDGSFAIAAIRDVSEGRQERASREETLAELREAQRIAHIGSWSWDTEVDEATWSPEMYRIFGRDPREGPATAEAFFAYVHPEDRDRLAAGYAQTFGGGATFELDYRIVRPDGSERVVHALGRAAGAPGRYRGTVQDVTELRGAERAARAAEDRAREQQQLLDETQAAVGVGSWEWGVEARVPRWSAQTFRLHGLDPADEPPSFGRYIRLVHPGDRDAMVPTFRRHVAERGNFVDEYRILHPTLGTRTLLLRGRWLAGDASTGRPERLAGTVEDVTAARAAQAAREEIEQRYRLLLHNLPDAVIALYDADLRCLLLQGPVLERAGLDPGDFEGLPIRDTLPAEQAEQLEPLLVRALAGEHGSNEYTSRLSGLTYHVDAAPYRLADGTIAGAFAVGRDVTEARAREQEMRSLATIVEQSGDAIMAMTLDAHIAQWNRGAETLFGYRAAEAVGRPVAMLVPPERQGEIESLVQAVRAGESRKLDTTRVRKDGTMVEVSISVSPIRNAGGEVVAAAVIARDITERTRLMLQLQFMAEHDPLTGLLNRRKFESELEAHVARVKRYGADGALIVLDIDDFKQVNDTLGHNAGDELIVAIARVLQARLRESDTLARLGGDEFAVLLPRASATEAADVARDLVEAVRDMVTPLRGVQARVTTSVGVAMFDGHAEPSGRSVLVEADLAMYEAKAAGHDGYAFYGAHESPIDRSRRA